MAKQVKHYGLTERVLASGKNFAKELEDVDNFKDGVREGERKVEEFIGVGQQIHNIIEAKNVAPEKKVAQLLAKTMNPFANDLINFTDEQIESTPGSEWTLSKYPMIPDPRVPRSMQKLNPNYVKFFPEVRDKLDGLVNEAREGF